ncbi:hypothetical protein [Levilactobacillus namurensis]|uniref:hypothetical protein n=1 Tax=Levilactobacillus namurensis TaxID=380393 RepID=UPI00222EFF31|nr:hypothetical protein [Levilactobacillus namurensis]MCW3777913.1 hypothetical protein [Levilactobacillus namurensis]MDT7018262.1 hypothetical protein [Levilactobacillus namurensis]WNN64751.1 hypothetical protein RIN67_08505 [Levilactobacillus namurensis]
MNVFDLLRAAMDDVEGQVDSSDDVITQKFNEFGPQRLIVSLEKDGLHVDMPGENGSLPFLLGQLFDSLAKTGGIRDGDKSAIVALMSEFVNQYLNDQSNDLVAKQEANARG